MMLIGKETFPTLVKWEIYELEKLDYSNTITCKICGDVNDLYYIKKDGIIVKNSFCICQSCLDGIGIMQSKLYE